MKKLANESLIILMAIVMVLLLSSASVFAAAGTNFSAASGTMTPAFLGTGDTGLDNLLAAGGFEYNPNKDIFQSTMNAPQRNFGYCGAYDLAAPAAGCIIDCEPITFEYPSGNRSMIEAWKGQYTLSTGFELGVYTRGVVLGIPGVLEGTFYHCANDDERLSMSYTAKKNENTLFSKGSELHWWLTGFKLGEFSNYSELAMQNTSVTLKTPSMCTEYRRGLNAAGYPPSQIRVSGNTVIFDFKDTRTTQPVTRTLLEWIQQPINQQLCSTYNNITSPYPSMADKLNAVRTQDSDLFDKVIYAGTALEIYNAYNTIKDYLSGGGGSNPVTRPTSSTPVSITEVTSITIGGETAVFQQDNNGPTRFIRADMDTEYDLESADIQINLVSSGTTVSSSSLTFTGSGTTRTADDVDLLNEAYDVTIGSTTYTLAADLPNGTVGVSASDPLKVASVTFTTTPSVAATVSGTSTDRYAGNPWYAQENHKWTEVSYYVKANSLLPSGTSRLAANRSAVPGTMTLGSRASASGCYSGGYFDLDQNLNVLTVSNGGESRDYHVSAGVTGQTVKVYYDIVLDEIENDGIYYTGDVVDQCEEINDAADVYFDPDGFYVDSGTTVMDIMEDFTDWAENNDYFSDTTVNSGGYLSALNGLGEFDAGSLSGWMYTDQGYSATCSVPWVGAADYDLTTDNTQIDWFFTTNYYNHF